jgi:hypothetical protein
MPLTVSVIPFLERTRRADLLVRLNMVDRQGVAVVDQLYPRRQRASRPKAPLLFILGGGLRLNIGRGSGRVLTA